MLLQLPMFLLAQDVWESPNANHNTENEDKTHNKTLAQQLTEEDSLKVAEQKAFYKKYVVAGVVPEIDGKVVWTLDVDVPGKSKQQLYDIMFKFLSDLTKSDNQLEGSAVSLVNKKDFIIAARIKEWLVFKDQLLSLDRTKMNYTLITYCKDGHLKVTMSNISYNYEDGQYNGITFYKAEDIITDKYAVSTKKKRLRRKIGKFREKTIDRKDQVFNMIRLAVAR